MQKIINDFQALVLHQVNVDDLQRLDNLIRNKKETLRVDFENNKEDVRDLINQTRENFVIVPDGGHNDHPGVGIGKWWFASNAELQPGQHDMIRGAVRQHVDVNGNVYVRLYDGNTLRVRWNVWHA